MTLFDDLQTPAVDVTPVAPIAGHTFAPPRADTTGPAALCGEAQPAGPVHAPTTRVLGIDLSLRRTGIATAAGAHSLTPPANLTGFPRLRWIRAQILERAQHAELLVIEGLSFASNMPSAQERAGLWHLVMVAVDARGTRWLQIPPATLKKYATGKGNAGKDEVLTAAVRRLPLTIDNNDQADAAWLCAAGHDLLGDPLLDLPAAHRAALDKFRTAAGSA